MFKPYLCSIKGFSLLEVMIALLVLGIGIIAVASMQTTSMDGIGRARQTTFNAVAAGRQLEQILSMSYNDNAISDPDGAYLPQNPDHGPFVITGTNGTIEWEVDDDFPLASTKRVTVIVRRPGKGGVMKSVRYNYIKARGYAP